MQTLSIKTIICVIFLTITLFACKSEFETLRVESCSPENHAYGIMTDTVIAIRFNNDVNKKDIEEKFSLQTNYSTVSGTFTWSSDSSFIFEPQDDLERSGHYTITVPEDIRDIKGNTMQQAFIADFYIGNDFQRPEVISSVPVYTEGGTRDVGLASEISVSFSKSMNTEKTEAAFSISPAIQGNFTWSMGTSGLADSVLTFAYTGELDYGRQYTITIASTAEDTEGNTLKEKYAVIFFTGSDLATPAVLGMHDAAISANPPYWSVNALNQNISKHIAIAVQFSEEMDQDSCELAFSISPSVPGGFSWDNNAKMIFTPTSSLSGETIYTITINSNAANTHDRTLSGDYKILIKTNASDSRYLSINEIQGSTNNIAFSTLCSGSPIPDNMPYAITRAGDGHYYIIIIFSTAMDLYSLYDSLTFKAIDPETGSIEKIEWINSTQLKVILKDLAAATTYRFTVEGGSYGVKDADGNLMENNFIFEIRE